ncbi:universal stress protein [Halorubrum vacuolatum]|uniref:Nucleotide-binding universal stress protein, UspA family n=1 Tax=Halorubrum vacuolatum TaxID=63740 RepID=A0A238X6Q2_HALVU|nr:universal stress protein [Halorubrum vacuolatum]SNR54223.1 Nucleotide-binding universal stress protein, UspA family [Halorubrum vacuolatum]
MDTSDVDAAEAEDGAGNQERAGAAAVRTFELSDVAVTEVASSVPTVSEATLKHRAGREASETLSSILVGVGGGPHSGATVDFARGLAAEADAWLELFHVVPASEGNAETSTADADEGREATDGDARRPIDERGERLLSAAGDRLDEFDCVDRWMVEGESPADAIVEQSAYYDAVVVGASTTGAVGRFVFSCTTDVVVDNAAAPVIVVEADGSTDLVGDT